MQVSRSGQIRTPNIHASSPTLTIAASSCSDAGTKLSQPQQMLHAEQEAGAAHTSDQNRDLHVTDIRPSGLASFG